MGNNKSYSFMWYFEALVSAGGVMVIVIGNGHVETSSNPGRDRLHFT